MATAEDFNFDDLHRSTQSNIRVNLEAEKGRAWRNGQLLAGYLEGILNGAGYLGPVAIAGGYMRDLALGREPKDLDVFIDGGSLLRMDNTQALAEALLGYFGDSFSLGRELKSYGSWAPDLEKVVKLQRHEGAEQLVLRRDLAVPSEIDLIVLRQDELVKAGFRPAVHMSHGTRASFLAAVLSRVDLRLNALGATSTGTDSAAQWNDDALHQRLVIQASRLEWETFNEKPGWLIRNTGEPVARRILARLKRLGGEAGKYEGWKVCMELPGGDLVDAQEEVEAHYPGWPRAVEDEGDGQEAPES